MIELSRLARTTTVTGALLSGLAAAMTVANASRMPKPTRPRAVITDSIVVCVPARNEEGRIGDLLADLRSQTGCTDLQVLVLDDSSTDRTFAAASTAVAGDPRFQVLRSGVEPRPGWTGKAAACSALADLAFDKSSNLPGQPANLSEPVKLIAFVDADVRLEPGAVAAAAATVHEMGVALVCPWPEQVASSVTEWLIQPLLSFSWMASLPIRPANRSTRPSTAVACGQFLMFDADSYREIGGHASVSGSPTEDLDIARVLRRRGLNTVLVSGAGLARCRMYDGWPALRDGYTRWLWAAYGGVPGSVGVLGALTVAFVVPPAAAVFGSGRTRTWGFVGYAAAVVSRLVSSRTESGRGSVRAVCASAAHPVSISLYIALTVESVRRRRYGLSMWKDRHTN